MVGYKRVKSRLCQILGAEQFSSFTYFKPFFLMASGCQKDPILTIDSCKVSFVPSPNFDTVGIRHVCTLPDLLGFTNLACFKASLWVCS